MPSIEGIYALCDTSLTPKADHFSLAKKLIEGGVSILQLRMKGEKDLHKVRKTAQSILNLKQNHSFTFIINDFVDIAIELNADGIHIGQDDMSIQEVLKKVKSYCLVGYSSHSLAEAIAAEQQGVSYVALGAIFPTTSKRPGHPVVGLHTLKAVVERLKVPVVAIGGIGRKNFSETASTGTSAIAMISALTCAEDITSETQWFVNKWKAAKINLEIH